MDWTCGAWMKPSQSTQGLQGFWGFGFVGVLRSWGSGFSTSLQGSKIGSQLARWSSDPAFRSLNPRANSRAAPTLRKAIRALRSFWSPGNVLSSRLSSKLGGGSASTTAGQDQGTWTLGVRASGIHCPHAPASAGGAYKAPSRELPGIRSDEPCSSVWVIICYLCSSLHGALHAPLLLCQQPPWILKHA